MRRHTKVGGSLLTFENVRVALVICGLFICEFAYLGSAYVDKTLEFVKFMSCSLAYVRFLI